MPANLTQQYRKAEEAYRRASTPEEELECLQVMLRELPKHKGTDKLQAELVRGGASQSLAGSGNGVVAAFVDAMQRYTGKQLVLVVSPDVFAPPP